MVRGDGLVIGWLGHPVFRLADNTQVYARRMPSFFETFPTLFVDATGVVRADQPFRRAEAKYAIEGVGLHVTILGGALAGIELDGPRQQPMLPVIWWLTGITL
jgi:photosystem II CP47 chlorophyll apoprotein